MASEQSSSAEDTSTEASSAPLSRLFPVFITHLNRQVTEAHLEEAFASNSGVVSVRVIRDPVHHTSKGFGFVNFSSADERDAAVREQQSLTLLGEPVIVRKGNDRPANPKHRGRDHSEQQVSNPQLSYPQTTPQVSGAYAPFPYAYAAGYQAYPASQAAYAQPSQQLASSSPSSTVYIGNIPDKMDDPSLRAYIERVLGFQLASFKRREHFAFVGFAHDSQAQLCIARLNGVKIGSLTLTVQLSKKPSESAECSLTVRMLGERLARALGLAASPLDSQQLFMLEKSYRTLYVGGLAWTVDRDELASCFAEYGSVMDTRIVKDRVSGAPRYGFVIFRSIEAVERAVQADEHYVQQAGTAHLIHGREVSVQSSRPPKEVIQTGMRLGLVAASGQPTSLLRSILSAVSAEVAAIESPYPQAYVRPPPPPALPAVEPTVYGSHRSLGLPQPLYSQLRHYQPY